MIKDKVVVNIHFKMVTIEDNGNLIKKKERENYFTKIN